MAKHFTELIIWQLADELRVETLKLAERPGFRRDLKLRTQMEDASQSSCRNIAEGFGCDTHREFARFLVISRRSLNELQDTFRGTEIKRFVTPADLAPARSLLQRLFPALGRFISYLRRADGRRSGRGS